MDVSFWAECDELSGANWPAWCMKQRLCSQLKWPGRGLCSRYVQGFEVAGRGVSHEWREAVSSYGIVCCLSRLCSNWCWASGSHIFQHTRIIKKKVVWSSHSVKVPAELNTQGCTLECSSCPRSRTCAWRAYTLRDHNDVMWRQHAIGLFVWPTLDTVNRLLIQLTGFKVRWVVVNRTVAYVIDSCACFSFILNAYHPNYQQVLPPHVIKNYGCGIFWWRLIVHVPHPLIIIVCSCCRRSSLIKVMGYRLPSYVMTHGNIDQHVD